MDTKICHTCAGSGEVHINVGYELYPSYQLVTCQNCWGTGQEPLEKRVRRLDKKLIQYNKDVIERVVKAIENFKERLGDKPNEKIGSDKRDSQSVSPSSEGSKERKEDE